MKKDALEGISFDGGKWLCTNKKGVAGLFDSIEEAVKHKKSPARKKPVDQTVVDTDAARS